MCSCSSARMGASSAMDMSAGSRKQCLSRVFSTHFTGKKLECKPQAMSRKGSLPALKVKADMAASDLVAEPSSPEKGRSSSDDTIQQFLKRDYKWGFTTDIKSATIPKGLSEDTVRLISAKKEEPEWLLEFRLRAFRQWQKMTEPNWSDNKYPPIDYQVRP